MQFFEISICQVMTGFILFITSMRLSTNSAADCMIQLEKQNNPRMTTKQQGEEGNVGKKK